MVASSASVEATSEVAMNRGRTTLIAALLAFALVAAACSDDDDSADTTAPADAGATEETTATEETAAAEEAPAAAAASCAVDGEPRSTTILLPFPFAVPFYSVFVADANGYFEDEGLNVSIESADGSASVVQQVVAGNVEFGMSDPGPIIDAVALGEDLSVVYVFQTGLIYGLVTESGSPYVEITDFTGETVGVSEATAGEVPFFEALLAQNGVDPDTDVTIIETGAGATTAAAFQGGDIVAYFSDFFNLIELGFEVDLNEFDLGEFGLLHAASVVVQQETIDNDPELITCITRAMARASEFTSANPAAGIAAIASKYPEQVTDPEGFDKLALDETLKRTEQYEESGGRWGFNRPASWEGYIDLLSARGELSADVDPTSLYTNDLIDAINDFDKQAEIDAANAGG